MSESSLGVESAREHAGSPMWNSNFCWHVQELWLGIDLVGQLRGCLAGLEFPLVNARDKIGALSWAEHSYNLPWHKCGLGLGRARLG